MPSYKYVVGSGEEYVPQSKTIYVHKSVEELLLDAGEGDGSDRINGYAVKKSDSSFGGFYLLNEESGEIFAPQDGWERRFRELSDAVAFAKSLPSIKSWEEVVEDSDIPLKGVNGVRIIKSYSLFVVVEKSRWGDSPLSGQAIYIGDPGYKTVNGAILFFWQWVEEQARKANPRPLVDGKNDATIEGDDWIRTIENSKKPRLLFPLWCLEGYQPSLFWQWLEWFSRV